MYYNKNTGMTIVSLPQKYTFSDGRTTGDFRELGEAIHKQEGFIPVAEPNVDYDPRYQKVTEGAIVVTGDTATKEITVEDIDIAVVKARRLANVNSLRDSKLAGGFTYDGKLYDSNDAAVANVQGIVLAIVIGIDIPEDFVWKAADNGYTAIDAAGVKALGVALMNHRIDTYKASWVHKAAIAALKTGKEVTAYDITIGW